MKDIVEVYSGKNRDGVEAERLRERLIREMRNWGVQGVEKTEKGRLKLRTL